MHALWLGCNVSQSTAATQASMSRARKLAPAIECEPHALLLLWQYHMANTELVRKSLPRHTNPMKPLDPGPRLLLHPLERPGHRGPPLSPIGWTRTQSATRLPTTFMQR